ncbi:MAG: SUF system NifU family Fe-S cluster assembly protein [SAR202 cluster bacterium]|nr:SUF system NifU family Fe-S cluster assembly protein [SAR202 cluster bacterium]
MGLNGLDDVYREAILDHSRSPRNREKLERADITADGVNPFCGDEIHVQIALDGDGRVARVGLQSVGCAINKATGSMLTETVLSMTGGEMEAVSTLFGRLMNGGTLSQAELAELGELKELAGVRRFPVRIKCTLLAWSTLREGIEEYRRNQTG